MRIGRRIGHRIVISIRIGHRIVISLSDDDRLYDHFETIHDRIETILMSSFLFWAGVLPFMARAAEEGRWSGATSAARPWQRTTSCSQVPFHLKLKSGHCPPNGYFLIGN